MGLKAFTISRLAKKCSHSAAAMSFILAFAWGIACVLADISSFDASSSADAPG